MKIFKNKSIYQAIPSELNEVLDGQVLIGQSPDYEDDSDNPSLTDNYEVHIKLKDQYPPLKEHEGEDLLTFEQLATFRKLNNAVSYGRYIEEGNRTYEYYVKEQKTIQSGKDPDIQVMGDLGWELCGILDSHMIYKRLKVE